jgi:hypothetical protein
MIFLKLYILKIDKNLLNIPSLIMKLQIKESLMNSNYLRYWRVRTTRYCMKTITTIIRTIKMMMVNGRTLKKRKRSASKKR